MKIFEVRPSRIGGGDPEWIVVFREEGRPFQPLSGAHYFVTRAEAEAEARRLSALEHGVPENG